MKCYAPVLIDRGIIVIEHQIIWQLGLET